MPCFIRALAVLAALSGCIPGATATAESHLAAAKRVAAAGDWKLAEQHSRLQMQAEPQDCEAAVLHAEALIHLGQPFDAVLELEKLLEAHAEYVPALKLYAATLVDVMNETSSAAPVLSKAAQLAPKDWQVWEALGKLHFRQRKPKEAVQAFRNAAALAPSNPEVASELARALDEVDDAAQAEAEHGRALRLNESLDPPLAGVYVRFATFLSNRDRLEESLAALNKALATDAHSSDALFGRAGLEEKMGKLRAAETDALAALRESPGRRDVRQVLIRIYRGLGENAKVDEQIATVKKLADAEQADLARYRDMRAALSTAERLLAEGKFREAVAPYEKVVGLMPTFYEAWFALGICYSQTGEPVRSEAALTRYLGLQPLSADGHSALGLLLFGTNRAAEARKELARALELNPGLDEPRAALAKLALDSRQYKDALSLLEPLLARRDGADAAVYALAANAHFLAGRKEEAISACEEGLRRHPDSVELEELHTTFLIDCGRTEACRLRAARWYAMRPGSPRYLRCAAELLVINKPLDDATEPAVRKAVAAAPEDASSHYLLAKWARARSDFAVARDEAIRAAALAGADESMQLQCLTLEGIAREALTDYPAAEAAFQKAWGLNRRRNPPSAESAMWYVRFLLAAGRFKDASERARDVLGWEPRNGPAHLALARVHDHGGRLEDAVREAELMLRYGSDDPEQVRAAHALLAKAYYAIGRDQDARTHEAWLRAR